MVPLSWISFKQLWYAKLKKSGPVLCVNFFSWKMSEVLVHFLDLSKSMLSVLRKHTDPSQWCVEVRIRNSQLHALSLRLAFLGLTWWFCWYRTVTSLLKCLPHTSDLCARQRWLTRPFVLGLLSEQGGIPFSRHSHAVGSSCARGCCVSPSVPSRGAQVGKLLL